MMRMSTRTHGFVDYLTGAALMIVPNFINCTARTRALMMGAGAGAALYSAMTKYELGAVKLLPMKAHLALDALSGGTFLAAAALMEDEEPEIRTALAGIGVFEIAAATLTEPHSVADDAPDRWRRQGKRQSRAKSRGRGKQSMPQAPHVPASA